MKKCILSLILVVFLLFCGCTGKQLSPGPMDFNSQESVSIMPDESIMISGNVYEHTYREFLRMTMTGKKHYTIRMHTNGGDGFSTVAIMHRIKALQKRGVKFTTIVSAKGFSAGAYIFMMGDTRIMNTGAQLMWHTIAGQQLGKARDNERAVVWETTDGFVVEEFERRFPLIPKKKINDWFWRSDMTWMNATEALLWGIATDVVY